MVDKLFDAASMFWQALDESERRTLLYLAVYLAVSVAWSLQQRSREQLRRELLAEMQRGSAG